MRHVSASVVIMRGMELALEISCISQATGRRLGVLVARESRTWGGPWLLAVFPGRPPSNKGTQHASLRRVLFAYPRLPPLGCAVTSTATHCQSGHPRFRTRVASGQSLWRPQRKIIGIEQRKPYCSIFV
ncbi:hypothetical protein IF1G_07073 [Cordyceps javanica]|uniref:Uncharacterized protein n=1 Tax=Cordyceps javanica TaxID=43265 RepID=A0A545UXJ6_9HYPO|nr:hypothetical protein IF1G_07073 [Cordyceps javanica]